MAESLRCRADNHCAEKYRSDFDAPYLTVCWVCTPAKGRELFQNERLCEAGLLPRFLVVDPKARAMEIPEDRAGEARAIPADDAIQAGSDIRQGVRNKNPAEDWGAGQT
ncbi:MAG: hypothetical protein WCQ16_02270 [Verrucomicrobiae bacterium]